MSSILNKLVWGFGAVIALALLVVGISILTRPAFVPPALPNPNGYDDLVKASKQLAGNYDKYDQLDIVELRTIVQQNAEALKLARVGLTRESRVPLDYNPNSMTNLPTLGALKDLARAFAAEGRLAESEKRPADAADAYLSAIKTGTAVEPGGLLIHGLVGLALKAIGLVKLEQLALEADAATCKAIVNGVEETEARTLAPEKILDQERAWVRQAYGWRAPILRLATRKTIKGTESSFLGKAKSHEVRTRVFLLKTASRVFELEKGKRPSSMADLVPDYIKAVPKDPFTGADLTLP